MKDLLRHALPRKTVSTAYVSEVGQRKHRGPHILTILLSLLTLLALFHLIAVVHSAYPTVVLDTCDKAIRNTDYTRSVSFTAAQEMSAVQFADTLTAGQPSALVQVVDKETRHVQDLYLYGCSMRQGTPRLTLLFKQQGLAQGTATITQANTLSIGQLDTTLTPNRDSFLLPMQENVYREYLWQDGALRQTTFPGLYPVISRSEAEALQEQANHELNVPWRDPLLTAQQLAQDLFRWQQKSFRGRLVEAGEHEARVRLIQSQLHMEVAVSLEKLVRPDSNGIWFVTGARTDGIMLTVASPPASRTSAADASELSRLTLQGMVIDGKSRLLSTLFDHTMTPLALSKKTALHLQGHGFYAGELAYTNPFPNQPGLLLIEARPVPPTASSKGAAHKNAQQNTQPAAGQLLLTNLLLN